jgi:hypothetical protein
VIQLVKQRLIGLRILDDQFRFAVDRQHDWGSGGCVKFRSTERSPGTKGAG